MILWLEKEILPWKTGIELCERIKLGSFNMGLSLILAIKVSGIQGEDRIRKLKVGFTAIIYPTYIEAKEDK